MSSEMSVVLTTSTDTRERFKKIVNQIKQALNLLTEEILVKSKQFNQTEIDLILTCKKTVIDSLDNKLAPFFLENENFDYRLNYKINNLTINDALEKFYNTSYFDYDPVISPVLSYSIAQNSDIQMLEKQYINNIEIDELKINLKSKVNVAIEGVERAKLAYENDKITKVYKKIYEDLDTTAGYFQLAFWGALLIGVLCAAISIEHYPKMEDINFWYSKVLVFSATITFATYFVKRSANLRKQADQLKREAWEMDALPIFIASLDEQSRNDAIKELIPKYFGKEVDQTQNDKIADIMKDQLTVGTELIKASAELVKSVKPSGVSESNNSNS